LLLIDAGVPPDIEPGSAELEDAFIYNLDDLERLASSQSGGRAAASALAWGIVEEELAGFLRAQAERPATPAVVALRRHFDAVRREVLAAGPADAEAVTRLLVNKLLHGPSEALRRSVAEDPELAAALEDMLRRLFDLSEAAPDDDIETMDSKVERERKEP
jgi:glutamyl-tRNA reductase